MVRKILYSIITLMFCANLNAQTNTIDFSKNLNLSGVKNIRDFGGYKVTGGKKIREHQLFSSEDLSKATDDDLNFIEDSLKISVIYDFRSSKEMLAAPDNLPNNSYYISLPCLEDEVSLIEDNIGDNEGTKSQKHLYSKIIQTKVIQEQYAEFLDSISVLHPEEATLIHCSQGKERTSWAVTYLLAALGADRATLVKEFMKQRIGESEKYVEDTLDMIDKQYGSIEQYLTDALKCDEEKRQKLRERFLIDY